MQTEQFKNVTEIDKLGKQESQPKDEVISQICRQYIKRNTK